jgi:deoxyribodipyrimidine photolyase-related protein
MQNLIILPNQLFLIENFKKESIKNVYIVEHPYYFTRFKFHKLKLAFFVAAMNNYKQYLEGNNIKAIYINSFDYMDFIKTIKKDNNIMFDPVDDVKNEFIKLNFHIMDTPMFLLNNSDLSSIKYRRLSAFYNLSKKIVKSKYNLDYLELENMDKMNRLTMTKKDLNEFNEIIPIYKNKYYTHSISYVLTNFPNNFGDLSLDNLNELPVTYKDAKNHLMKFIKERFQNFGPYQDFMSKNNTVLYHSNISHLLNIGLLTPLQVLKEVEKYRGKVSKQSFEGFIRQVIGWREYMRYIYVKNPDLSKENFWNNKKKLNWKKFYDCDTKITYIDAELVKAKASGWSHHIIRLMVFLNYFILAEIDPKDINRWFQEVIALDSYEWVMVSNIWTMGYFTKNFTSKPYFVSSNYIKKMSDFNNKDDFKKLDEMYHKFLDKKKDYKFNRY